MTSYSPSTTWTSPTNRVDARPFGDEPGPGWMGWLTVVAVLAVLFSMLIVATPS
jgi:hypothetical protein